MCAQEGPNDEVPKRDEQADRETDSRNALARLFALSLKVSLSIRFYRFLSFLHPRLSHKSLSSFCFIIPKVGRVVLASEDPRSESGFAIVEGAEFSKSFALPLSLSLSFSSAAGILALAFSSRQFSLSSFRVSFQNFLLSPCSVLFCQHSLGLSSHSLRGDSQVILFVSSFYFLFLARVFVFSLVRSSSLG